MGACAIIPARYGSKRLPGKPLLCETGKPLIQHVVESVRRAKRIERIVVATDDERIAHTVRSFGGEAVMTRTDHECGTDRIAEAAQTLALDDGDIVVNIQGDEPDITQECIDRLVGLLETYDGPMATLATRLGLAEAADPNKVKVVLARNPSGETIPPGNERGVAMYFSRAKIPHDRDGAGEARYLLHLGIYAYRVGFLKQFADLSPTPAERTEKLEQLRALEHGFGVAVAVVDYKGSGIDTSEDYAAFVARIKRQ